jgi:lysophospholipase L1-like esterase
MWQSFDEISKKNGFLLVTDGIHMNSRGAAIIADQIESFLRASE